MLQFLLLFGECFKCRDSPMRSFRWNFTFYKKLQNRIGYDRESQSLTVDKLRKIKSWKPNWQSWPCGTPPEALTRRLLSTVMKKFKNTANIWNKREEWECKFLRFLLAIGPAVVKESCCEHKTKPATDWLIKVSEWNKTQAPMGDCSCTQKCLTTHCLQDARGPWDIRTWSTEQMC